MRRRPHSILPVLAWLAVGCATPPPTTVDPPATAKPSSASPGPTIGSPSVSATARPEAAIDHRALGVDYILPGPVIRHEGEWHLWAVVFDADAPRAIHLVSPDLADWSGDAATAALDRRALGLDAPGPVPSSVVIETDGTWTMYGGGRLPGDEPVIWRATAPGPDGPWTFHPEPVLRPSADGWDSAIVDHPSVVRTPDGYLMAHGGAHAASSNRGRIGFAVSTDGISWQAIDATLPGADDDRALGPTACGIVARTMFEPELSTTDDGYRLSFAAMLDGTDEMVIGLATSSDARSWTCAADGPTVTPADIGSGASMHAYTVIPTNTGDALLIEVLGPDGPFSDLVLVPLPDR